MNKYLRTLRIPEGRVGKFRVEHITHPANEEMVLSNARTSIMGGQKPGTVSFPEVTVWRSLIEEGQGVWMTDLPIEQAQHFNILEPITEGSVLIGGLGLGLSVSILRYRDDVEITIVEQSPEIIALVKPSLPDGVRVIQSDLFAFLRRTKEDFRWAFYDIWQSDGEGTFFDVVVPLITLSERVIEEEPICWNEDVMRGQLLFSLHGRYTGPELAALPGWKGKMMSHFDLSQATDDKWLRWSVPFFEWVVLEQPDREAAEEGMGYYAGLYGKRDWLSNWEDLL